VTAVLTLDEALEELRRHVGAVGEAVSMVVEATAIRRFAEAIGDPNPLYHDDEYARATRWGGTIAPPTFLCLLLAPVPRPEVDFGTVQLNGGSAFASYRPVRPGDVIVGQATFADVRAVRGRSGEMLIHRQETRYTNGHGQLVALGTGTGIQR
jgi:acyl dehydratase